MINFRNDVLSLKNKLYRLALRITLDTAEAEDIVQETMIRMWNRRLEWEQIDSIEAFGLTICRNLALDSLKKKNQHNDLLNESHESTPDNALTPQQALDIEDKQAWVMKLFNQLPERQRSVMQLRDIEGKSYKEIAQVMGLSEDQVKVTLFRARQYIRQEFQKIDNYGL